MTISIRTPAKLNLGLEVLRRRPDGYHDLATIFQAIDIYDIFHFTECPGFTYRGDGRIPEEQDIARPILERAAGEQGWSGVINLEKVIPIAAGLGGGSSDAALALRLAHASSSHPVMPEDAARFGADVPFFVRGGTARGAGIGDDLRPLPTPGLWFTVHVPEVEIAAKTAKLFSGLTSSDFSDGSQIESLEEAITAGPPALPDTLPNAFQRQMLSLPEIDRAWRTVERYGGRVALSGAGPAIFSWHERRDDSESVADLLRNELPGKTFLCRALPPHRDTHELLAFRRQLVEKP